MTQLNTGSTPSWTYHEPVEIPDEYLLEVDIDRASRAEHNLGLLSVSAGVTEETPFSQALARVDQTKADTTLHTEDALRQVIESYHDPIKAALRKKFGTDFKDWEGIKPRKPYD